MSANPTLLGLRKRQSKLNVETARIAGTLQCPELAHSGLFERARPTRFGG